MWGTVIKIIIDLSFLFPLIKALLWDIYVSTSLLCSCFGSRTILGHHCWLYIQCKKPETCESVSIFLLYLFIYFGGVGVCGGAGGCGCAAFWHSGYPVGCKGDNFKFLTLVVLIYLWVEYLLFAEPNKPWFWKFCLSEKKTETTRVNPVCYLIVRVEFWSNGIARFDAVRAWINKQSMQCHLQCELPNMMGNHFPLGRNIRHMLRNVISNSGFDFCSTTAIFFFF